MKKKYLIYFLVLLFAIFFLKKFNDFLRDYLISLQKIPPQAAIIKQKKPPLDLEVKAAISKRIYNSKKTKILYQKMADEILPIASLTKLFTATIVLENPNDYPLEKTITISEKAASQENVPEKGNYLVGDKISVERLLKEMIAFSSNDGAYALAEQIGVENFVDKMNEKAKKLSLLNTHFVNPTGLDPEAIKFSSSSLSSFNFSTAKDLANFAQYLIENYPFIFEISLSNGNFQKIRTQKTLVGGKTGYTDEAGGCMVLVLKDNAGYIINVILGASSPQKRIEEMQKLINWIENQ
jgi:D-alanyl-D-alanine carboxypeptidase (penicillin-binding protein 5/6)